MDPILPNPTATELAAGIFQGVVTLLLALLCGWLAARYHRMVFRWWTVAWGLYVVRILCILAFLTTGNWDWLYLHQVVTGWTAVALLLAALAWIGRPPSLATHIGLALFPPLWSWVAIYELDDFFWASLPAVLFLSAATLWTGIVFFTHRRRALRSGTSPGSGATVLATTFLLWGLHHLNYPLLRARGAWNPWGYYLDILFLLGVGAGILLLVVDEQRGGIERLSQRMLIQHEEERRRLSRELHDETAQVLSAVKMQLGVLAESLAEGERARLMRAQDLLDEGIRGIRHVTDALRPSLLDDLGLVPALRSLVEGFRTRSELTVELKIAALLPKLTEEAELALFRALQEGLSNVAQHAAASHVRVELQVRGDAVELEVEDDGRGMAIEDLPLLEREGHMGIAGMRERIHAVNGSVELRNASRGTVLRVTVPLP
ncbi:MAG: sensor histidine kinase [Gemmatimonadota bacterium]